jgi:flagellar basal body rod protein FlgB
VVYALLYHGTVIHNFIGRVSQANQLKDALDVGSSRVRAIADRVSKASLQNQDGFALPSSAMPAPGQTAETAASSAVDLESEMTNLADAQLRYETTSKLLSKAYAQIRASMRDK